MQEELIITDTMNWIDANVAEETTRDDLVRKVEGADLPRESKDAMGELPDGTYSNSELKRVIKDALIAKIGQPSSTMKGFGGSM